MSLQKSVASVLLALLLPALARPDVFLLGDITPVYSLSSILPHNPEAGNQELFRRFVGSQPQGGVLIRAGDRFPDHAAGELHQFYGLEGIPIDDKDVLAADTLEFIDLVIVGNPDWRWHKEEVDVISEFLSRGGNLLVIVERGPRVRDSANSLLTLLGSSLRVGAEVICCFGSRWAMLADQPLMRGVHPVSYGASHSIDGGTPLMYHEHGLSMLSIDKRSDTASVH